jgi:hypothetical protein
MPGGRNEIKMALVINASTQKEQSFFPSFFFLGVKEANIMVEPKGAFSF